MSDKEIIAIFASEKRVRGKNGYRLAYWLDIATYDVETAETLYKGG